MKGRAGDAPQTIGVMLQRGLAAHQAGDLAQAEYHYRRALSVDKKQFDALHMLGVVNAQRGDFFAAEQLFRQASAIRPDHAPCLYNRGNALAQLGQFDEAIACYNSALALAPSYIEAYINRGNALLTRARFADALASFDAAARLNPAILEIHAGRGNALRALKRLDEALACFDRLVPARPDDAALHAGRGNVLHDLGRRQEALASFQTALRLSPRDARLHYNIGNVLWENGHLQEALVSFNAALTLDPDDAECLQNRGNVLLEFGRAADAFADYEAAWSRNPRLDYLEGARLHAKMRLCAWSQFDEDCARLLARVRKGEAASLPFPLLALPSSPSDQLACARAYVDARFPGAPPRAKGASAHDRLRVTYLSADFHDHATAQLAAGLFESHDRARFEIAGISFGPDDHSPMRARLTCAFDRFVDVRDKSATDIARLIADMGIDIAVDINGHTQGARTAIVAMRPAPLQVAYLAYPGTTGAPYMDYLLADRIVLPPDDRRFYAEKVVYLPHSYQCNDRTRPIAPDVVTRAKAGLPEQGFVFCSFNNGYKILPDIFALWMRLLQRVDGSVLWLLESNATAADNLRAEAQRHGVQAERIVFAPKMPVEQHLARQRLADLCLDTLPYNAHTTASDSLWAGVPLVTCLGTTFAGRVAASLLTACGLGELITTSLADYEALALRLAREPVALAAIKSKLAANRETCPLFDSARFTRYIEAAYEQMWERHRRGETPAEFAVDA